MLPFPPEIRDGLIVKTVDSVGCVALKSCHTPSIVGSAPQFDQLICPLHWTRGKHCLPWRKTLSRQHQRNVLNVGSKDITISTPVVLQPSAKRSRRNFDLAFFITLILGVGIYITAKFAPRLHGFQLMPSLAVASLVILVGMAGIYFQEYQFKKDLFFGLAAVGWLGSGTYIFLEGFYAEPAASLEFDLWVFSYALVSFVAFYLASFVETDQELPRRRVLTELALWFIIIGANLLAVYRFFPDIHNEDRFARATIAGVIFSSWTLFRTGRALRARLNARHGAWRSLFPLTFYLYALLQPIYIFKLASYRLTVIAFCTAFVLKVLNGVCIVVVVQRDLGEVRERIERISILEDLGILTASIEHDIRNPLVVIRSQLRKMKERFQSDIEVLNSLAKIEPQLQRISATSEIIKTLRGGRDYYEKFMERTSIGDLVNRSIKAVKEEFKTSNILYKTDGSSLYTKAYMPVLQQGIVNVLKNAVEAIQDAGREKGHISIVWGISAIDSSKIILDITDDGIGISADNIPKLGQLFTTKKDRKANSGIGLFITKRILEFHEGRIDLQSTAGSGTTVSLILPMWSEEN
jgi:signal transduction histidine kinase